MNRKLLVGFVVGFMAAVGLLGLVITSSQLDTVAQAQNKAMAAEKGSGKWSPTKPYPERDVYYPSTEELKPDEMRVIFPPSDSTFSLICSRFKENSGGR